MHSIQEIRSILNEDQFLVAGLLFEVRANRANQLLLLFIDYASRDLRLKAGSPAIDAGVNLGYKLDFNNNPIPAGKFPDMGACEYQPYGKSQ
jgi:hypothetical protein